MRITPYAVRRPHLSRGGAKCPSTPRAVLINISVLSSQSRGSDIVNSKCSNESAAPKARQRKRRTIGAATEAPQRARSQSIEFIYVTNELVLKERKHANDSGSSKARQRKYGNKSAATRGRQQKRCKKSAPTRKRYESAATKARQRKHHIKSAGSDAPQQTRGTKKQQRKRGNKCTATKAR